MVYIWILLAVILKQTELFKTALIWTALQIMLPNLTVVPEMEEWSLVYIWIPLDSSLNQDGGLNLSKLK